MMMTQTVRIIVLFRFFAVKSRAFDINVNFILFPDEVENKVFGGRSVWEIAEPLVQSGNFEELENQVHMIPS
jgi:hypothetical protein